MRLRRRISTGSIPIFDAARSTRPSVTEQAMGWPTARYWHITFLFWNTTRARARIHRIRTDAGKIVDLERRDRPVTLDPDPPLAAMVAGVNVGVEAFDPVGDELERQPQQF